MFKKEDVKNKILYALLLIQESAAPLLTALRPDWPDLSTAPLQARLDYLKELAVSVDIKTLFPLQERLSTFLQDPHAFALSHLEQPRLFLRIRPGFEDIVPEKLFKAGIRFNKLDHAIELANGTDVEHVLTIDKEVVVQDLSSQRIRALMIEIVASLPNHPLVWDACAASGGKSILLYDVLPSIHLQVSDVRASILENLKKRFAQAGLKQYQAQVFDLAKQLPMLDPQDLVMADVPCSGSGTWGRTPEALLYFDHSKWQHYVQLQRNIIDHTIPLVKVGGHYLYMTCSVYAAENEEQVQYILDKGLTLRKAVLIEGWQHHADSLFAAWFTR